MISKSIEERIEDVDVLTDFDGTMIREESEYMEVLNYFFRNPHQVKFVKEVIKEYIDYKKTKNVAEFFSLFSGCPAEVLDNVARNLNQNEEWNELIEKEKPETVGILSRNNWRLISEYLTSLNFFPAKIIVAGANIPEIKKGIYTGKARINVSNENLASLIGKKEYICRAEEKRIIEKSDDFNCKRLKGGLYICKRGKIF